MPAWTMPIDVVSEYEITYENEILALAGASSRLMNIVDIISMSRPDQPS